MDSDVRMGGRQGHRCLVRHTQLMQEKMPKLNQKKLVSFGKKMTLGEPFEMENDRRKINEGEHTDRGTGLI